MTDYYQVLGVTTTASQEEIRQRYRFLVKAYHPDRFSDPESKAQAEEEMKRLNEAYAVLSNPEKRSAYDYKQKNAGEKRKEGASESETAAYFNSLMEYFGKLYEKWHYLLENFPHSEELNHVFELMIKGITLLMRASFYDQASPPAQAANKDIQEQLAAMMMMTVSLGAELGTQALPKEYQLIELEVFASMAFYNKIYNLSHIARHNGSISGDEIEGIVNSIVELSLELCVLCVNEGVIRVKQPSQEHKTGSSTAPKIKKNNQKVSSEDLKKGFCQSCLRFTPTEKMTFVQNIGVVVYRFTRTMKGNFCAKCAELYFWQFTSITLLFGWWGFVSIILTPFILLLNIYNYLKAWKLRKYSPGLSSIALGGKFVVLAFFVGIALLIQLQKQSNQNSSYQSATTEQIPLAQTLPHIPAITSPTGIPVLVYVQPTITKPACLLWSEVTVSDAGRDLCVYGVVKKAYFVGDMQYITFGPNINDFRMLVIHYYFKNVIGKCVRSTGVVKTYEKIPYIELGSTIDICSP